MNNNEEVSVSQKVLRIEASRTVIGEMRLGAPRMKDGSLVLPGTLTTIIEDDVLDDVKFSDPIAVAADAAVKVRKGAGDNAVVGTDMRADLRPFEAEVWVRPVRDGRPVDSDEFEVRCPATLKSVRLSAGKRHTKQVAVIRFMPALAEPETIGKLVAIGVSGDVAVKVRRAPGAQTALPFGELEDPPEEAEGEQLPLEPGEDVEVPDDELEVES